MRRPLASVALALLTVAGGRAEFQLSKNGVGPIVMETQIEVNGTKAEFTGTARNDSGVPIQRAEWCVQARGQKACAFKLWTSSTWQPGETLKWDLAGKAVNGMPAHEVSLTKLESVPPVPVKPGPRPGEQRPVQRKEIPAVPGCTYFTVVTQDKLNNIKQGLSPDDVKWFHKEIAEKYPGVCYAAPAPTVPVVFYVTVTPDVYHGARVENDTSTHDSPVRGTVTDQDGNTSQVDGTVETTTTTSTAVPYSVDYGIYTLSVERRRSDGKFDVAHRFQQKGLYNALFGVIPLGGKGYHPLHTVIEDAAKRINSGGLLDQMQGVLNGSPK
jgi:hypothetical protein